MPNFGWKKCKTERGFEPGYPTLWGLSSTTRLARYSWNIQSQSSFIENLTKRCSRAFLLLIKCIALKRDSWERRIYISFSKVFVHCTHFPLAWCLTLAEKKSAKLGGDLNLGTQPCKACLLLLGQQAIYEIYSQETVFQKSNQKVLESISSSYKMYSIFNMSL